MPVELIDEQELVEALRPFRPDRAAFERGVQDYLRGRAALAEQDPARDLPPLARAAAAVLPLPLLTGSKVASSATASSGIGQKLLGIALFPAVSLFVLLGATVLSFIGLRRTQFAPSSQQASPIDYEAAIRGWWHDHWIPTLLMYAGAIALMYFGASGWIFPLLIASLGALVAVVRSLASRGLGNRTMLAGTLMTPLILLFQLTSMFNFGDGSISLLDPRIVSYVFMAGVFCLGFISVRIPFGQGRINRNAGRLKILFAMYFPITLLLLLQVRIPPSPDAIKQHVEAFDRARFGSATWRDWEIPARWTIEAGLNPDLSKPRRLFERRPMGEPDPFTLGIAFRVGLVAPADIPKLRDLEEKASRLLDQRDKDEAILSLGQQEWLIRAMLMTNELDDTKRDFLAARLDATLPRAAETVFGPLRELLLITQLLAAIDRPVDPKQHRELVHAMLLKAHRTEAFGFAPAGGFASSLNSRGSDDVATADAVELMQIYGVPAELDINWVRSYAKPQLIGDSTRKWTDAITRQRLAAIPGVQPPTAWQWLYYERNLLAAVILVGLCIYAVWISPVVQPTAQQST